MERILALDIGDKRIGIAVSGPMGIIAQGVETYVRKTEKDDIIYIRDMAKKYGSKKIVAGFPVNMNGTAGPQADKVKAFMEKVEEKTPLSVDYWDERLTTAASERILISADVSRAKRKKVVDKMAAVLILQSYMSAVQNNRETKEKE